MYLLKKNKEALKIYKKALNYSKRFLPEGHHLILNLNNVLKAVGNKIDDEKNNRFQVEMQKTMNSQKRSEKLMGNVNHLYSRDYLRSKKKNYPNSTFNKSYNSHNNNQNVIRNLI